MRIVFAGTPEFGAATLARLLGSGQAAGFEVVAAYTQPDRPAGRGRRLLPSAVKQLAASAGVPVAQPPTLRDTAVQAGLAALRPDVMVVAAYGLLLPPAVLALPVHGCVNVHASLLPRWRGAAPIQRAILAGDTRSGVSIMRMEAGLDTGPVFTRASCPIEADDTAATLHDRLAVLGASALVEALPAIATGTLHAIAQDEARATHAPRLEKSEAWLDWTRPARELERAVRAYDPFPVAYTLRADPGGAEPVRLRIWAASVDTERGAGTPGEVIGVDRDGIAIQCNPGVLRLRRVQAPGARAMDVASFLNAHRVEPGERLAGPDPA